MSGSKAPGLQRLPSLELAQRRVMTAAMTLAGLDYAGDPAPAAYAMALAQLACAARDLTAAIDALPADRQPAGWTS